MWFYVAGVATGLLVAYMILVLAAGSRGGGGER